MARLSKHGELGQIEKLDHKLAYCSDGQVLRNNGDGWKVWRKLKPGIDPVSHFHQAQTKYAEKLANNPAFRHWRELFHAAFPFRLRFMALQAISLMPDDSDGVCSEINDFACLNGGVELINFQEAADLCSAYRLAMREANEAKAQTLIRPEMTPA